MNNYYQTKTDVLLNINLVYSQPKRDITWYEMENSEWSHTATSFPDITWYEMENSEWSHTAISFPDI